MVSGERIRQARELRQLTQQELANRVDVSQTTIALIERGQFIPNNILLDRLALNLAFPVSFLRKKPAQDFPLGSLLYRSHSTVKSTERNLAHRYAQIAFELSAQLANRIKLGANKLPRVSESPKLAAQLARSSMGLSPDTPIPHVIRACERAGVLIVSIPVQVEKLEAFSLWAGKTLTRPVIAVSSGRPGDRVRLSVAHELGHLVMHETLTSSLQEAEREAYQFAGEFLVPEEPFRQELGGQITLASLVPLKKRWGVSLQALAMRAKEIGVVSDRQCRYLFEQMSQKGWRKKEPAGLEIPAEKPRALRQMAELLYGEPLEISRMAADFNVTREFLLNLLEPYDRPESSKVRDRSSVMGQVLDFALDQSSRAE